ncbi:PspA/IM30 family protein [Thiohalocapsa sp. ML1]|jgi:phage shock protein A|uniref:PspA/IM30 family protein n=1 Tax=Thiohalocapsa sp. ML1 TaxID=1431688 RepID=UPI000731F86C|nr:PspA/IM30 family protein [Thiohalocapsa sp. ML1]
MALMTRLSRLLRADLHALLDRLEAPDILLAQGLRDMEDALAADAATLATLRRRQEALAEQESALARAADADADQLDVCLDAGEDDLARGLLRRRLERERLATRLAQASGTLTTRIRALEAALDERRQRLEMLRAEATRFAVPADDGTDRQAPSDPLGGWDALAPEPAAVRDADVEVALLAAKRRRPA